MNSLTCSIVNMQRYRAYSQELFCISATLGEDAGLESGMAAGPERQRRGIKRLSLRARLLLLVVATILPLTGFTLARRYFDYREAVENAGRKTLDLSRGLALSIEKDLQARIAVLQVLARSRALAEGNLEVFRLQAEAVIAEQFPGSSILVLRPDGQQEMNTRLLPGTALPARIEMGTIRQVLATGQPAVSDVFVGVVAKQSLVSIDVPVKRADGTIVHILSLNPPFDAFADTIRRQRLPATWLAAVVDRQGVTVTRSRDPDKFVGQKLVQAVLDRMAVEREGTLETTSREGIEVVSAFTEIRPFGWSVAMGVPHDELTAPAIHALLRVLAAAGVVFLLGLVLAIVLARQVTRPMATLRRLATTADGGEILAAPSTGLAEADEVLQALVLAERRRQQSDLGRNKAERQSQRIFETSLDVILVTDGYGTIVQASPSVATTIGFQPEEMVGHSGTEFIAPGDLDAIRAEMRLARQGRGARHFKASYVHKDRHLVPLLWMGVWSQPDRRYFFVGRDMTEYNRTEEQLRQALKMEAIGSLTGGMAHDFNNLLGIVIGNLDLVRPLLGDNEDAAELIDESIDAATRGAELTKRLLAFARKQPLQARTIAVNEVVAGTASLLGRTLGERIEISLDLAADIWPAIADPFQLEAALVNLATNARDAMADGGRLTLRTRNRSLDSDYAAAHPDVAPGDYAMIEVGDTGSGMAPEIVARVFEPFFTTKARGSGTGLGLAMVFGFMRQSAGHVAVYSEPGVGTIFRLYLPRADSAVAEAATETEEPHAAAAGEIVLAVEDNEALRRVALRQLRELGYRALEADNATAALAILEGERVDLLFSDVVMPGGMDGMELARIVRERWPHVRILMTSGFVETKVRGDLSLTGHPIRLLAKPYRRSELAKALHDVLHAPPTSPNEEGTKS